MKKFIKKFIKNFKYIFDIGGLFFFGIAALLMKIYRAIGVKNLKYSTKFIKFIGIFPLRNHYYEPQFKNEHLKTKINQLNKDTKILYNKKFNINLFSNLKFSKELLSLKLDKKKNINSFYIDNPFFPRGDADFLYQFVRQTKPKNIIEIGSGYSTLIMNEAIKRNSNEKIKCNITCIDPGKITIIDDLKIKRIKKKVENCDLSFFKKLKKNDLLLIDSTHVIKPFGDVLKIYLEIIPSINKGVNICVHDIFTPYSYPSEWLIDQNLFWNEQYLLEALLMNKNKYKIIAPLFFMSKNYFNSLKNYCPYLNVNSKPSSFYFKKLK